MKVAQEFSRFAATYERHNRIQAMVAKRLVSMLPEESYDSILDLGCGSGEVYRNLRRQGIDFGRLTAVDISDEMLLRHPSDEGVEKVRADFNDPVDLDRLSSRRYDLLLSSSALQWSSDLDLTLSSLSSSADRYALALFTSGTFRSLHRCAGIDSPIYSDEVLREKIAGCCEAVFETISYRLHFDSVYAMLRYIKESGTSGGERRLSYLQMKRLLGTYPLDYLEFEVLFATAK